MSERERFEAWAKSGDWVVDRYPQGQVKEGNYRHWHVECAWAAWQAACPEGWQCVPKEPTVEMGLHGANSMLDPRADTDDAKDCYRAMLSAVPKPEGA